MNHQPAASLSSAGGGQEDDSTALRYIWVIIGPAGCGKTSVARYMVQHLNVPFLEGDEYHPAKNIEKMSNGIPLTDDDRWGWLNTLWREAVREINGGSAGCVVTCSCLKQSYRDVMRAANREANVALRFIYLRADKQLLLARVKARTGHYMKDSMVESQFNDLEEPREVEQDVASVDVSGTLESVQNMVMTNVYKVKNEFS